MTRNSHDFFASIGMHNPNSIITLYRGLNRHPDDVDMKDLGVHWTPDIESAKMFATSSMGLPMTSRDRSHGTIVQATFDRKDIVPEGSKEHTDLYEGGGHSGMGTYGFNSDEKEITIRRGAEPDIDKVHHLKWNSETKQADFQ